MKKYLYTLMVMLVMPYVFTSCSKDEDSTELSENCYISKFSLGALKRSMYLKTSAGMDSIYTTSFLGSYFPMSIDQRTQIIENDDSLPTRTRLDKVLTTVVFDGVLVWRPADLTNVEDTTWHTYSSTDSLDLTNPLHFRVYSSSGLSSRTYTVKVNVHQQRGDSTVWHNLGEMPMPEGIGERKALAWEQHIIVWGRKNDGSIVCLQRHLPIAGEVNIQAADKWTVTATTGTKNADVASIQLMGDTLYMSTTDGDVIASTNSIDWVPTAYPTLPGLRLVAASEDYLYALRGQELLSSKGHTWVTDLLDDDATNLPISNLNSVYSYIGEGMGRVVLVGSRNDTDQTATLWFKRWDKGEEDIEKWCYYTPNNTDKDRCPMLDPLCVLSYDNGLQALGGRSRDGRYAAMDSIFHSSDSGVTWKTYTNNDMNVDPELRTQAQTAQYITATVDYESYMWVIVDKNVWRGHINRLGFLRQDRY